MTLLEAKDFLKNKYFSNCKTAKEVQEVLGEYTLECFGEKNGNKAMSELQKIQTKLARKNPVPTPEIMNVMFSEFGNYIKKKKLAIKEDFNPTTFIIMTVVAAELEAELSTAE